MIDIQSANALLRDARPEQIIDWALALSEPTIMTTSFGPNSGALLNMVSARDASVPVIWVDSGYHLRDTYVVAEQLIARLGLNMHVFVPKITAERLNIKLGGIPTLQEPDLHQEFTNVVKLEPFRRALEQFAPRVWISGVRRQDTDFRKSLDILSYDRRGILKVAPLFYWSDQQIEEYMQQQNLPSCRHYYDPTKVESGRECGLHTAA